MSPVIGPPNTLHRRYESKRGEYARFCRNFDLRVPVVTRCQSNTLDNLQVESMQSRNMRWRVRQQSNLLDTKIAQHLTAEPDMPKRSFRVPVSPSIRN